ncbi:MAG: S-layer homology domain-containing protein [Dethiosulfatibacter sp.]|nr:S-layer homology domain-containing protein [Dethiosulfatibacter sp.]
MNISRQRVVIFIIIAMMFFSNGFHFAVDADATTVELLITGTGVNQEVSISTSDWAHYTLRERTYSTNNSLNFHKIIKAKGYDLFELIGINNLKTDIDYVVKFTCADGFEFTKTISELKNTYYYSDFSESSKVQVNPMIAKYSAVLADFPPNSFSPPVQWTDRNLTESDLDKDFPKLVFGQTGIDDMNMSKWGKEVIRITIGDSLPVDSDGLDSPFKHISYEGAPYNVDAITSATLTIEGPAVEGYRAISLRQIEEDLTGQEQVSVYENLNGEILLNTFEGINVEYLIDNYVKVKENAGNMVFKNNSRQTILSVPVEDASKYTIAYGINDVPLVYLDSDVGYNPSKNNDGGCFKLVYEQSRSTAKAFSNVAYIYIEEKDAKNIFEHTYAPYNDPKYVDYEIIIHGNKMTEEVRYKVSDIESMTNIHYENEYSLSNSEYFWYYNRYKGVKLWDLLLRAGLDPEIDESTSIQFIAADNYNFAPMTIKEIKDNSLYGYYEKDATDLGDGNFDGNGVKPLHTGMPILVTYGFNGYPYVIRPTDAGFNPGLGNDGGPLRVIFGKTNYNDTNGSNQVQFLKEIIIGGGDPVSTGSSGTGEGETTHQDIDKSTSWNHNRGVYKDYLDTPVLRVTGSQVKEPMTFTLRQVESMIEFGVRDIYTGDGVHEFEGIVLWDLISEFVGLEEGVETPNIRVFAGQNYNQILRSPDQVINGVLNSQGNLKKIILAYAINGHPLVPNEGSVGYTNNNAYGPLRLIMEESKSMWVKWVDCIVVGTGDYEAPEMKDVKELDLPDLEDLETSTESGTGKIWLTYQNSTGKEMTEASVRSMAFDQEGNLWIGTNNGGLSVRTVDGKWSNIKEIETDNAGFVKLDTTYAIVQRENGELWMTLGSPVNPQGILVRTNSIWKLLNTENSLLPGLFAQELALDGNGGLWIGTQSGAVHVDKDDNWSVYTSNQGLLPYSVDAIEPDGQGGAWIGYYPATVGSDANPIYKGGYQHLAADGKITTYEGFNDSNFNLNWVRSISMDSKGGVWVVRSGNAPGLGQGEMDYIIDGERTVYQAKDLYPSISDGDDIRLVMIDREDEDAMYIATLASGLLKADGIGNVTDSFDATSPFPTRQWNNVFFMDIAEEGLLIGTNGGAAVYAHARTFKDISSHWAKNDIEMMATMGYIKGSDGQYHPDNSITRAEFVAMMVRILGLSSSDISNLPFTDVKQTDWFAGELAAAAGNGLIKGYSDNTFKPNAYINRNEIGSIIGNLLDSNLTSLQITEALDGFTDDIPQWARDAVAATVNAGIIKGFPDRSFGGTHNATRGQAATILLRFLKY